MWFSGAAIKLRHREFTVAKCLGGGESPVCRTHHHVDERIASLIERHFTAQHAGNINIDMLTHGANRLRVSRDLDYRYDRVSDDIALARRERVDDIAAGRH